MNNRIQSCIRVYLLRDLSRYVINEEHNPNFKINNYKPNSNGLRQNVNIRYKIKIFGLLGIVGVLF